MKVVGIYQIRNKVNNKVYVGQSNNLGQRKRDHFSALRHNNHFNSYLQYSFLKYGESNFEFEILEIVPIEFLTQREQHWLDIKKSYNINSGYNIAICAKSFMRGKRHTQQAKLKISKALKGKKHTEEHIRKVSLAQIGKKRKPHTEGQKCKIRLASLGHKHSKAAKLKMSLSHKGILEGKPWTEARRQAQVNRASR